MANNIIIKSFLLFFILFFNFLNAATIEDIAYKAFKEGDPKKAFMLYKEGAKADSLKSYLMLGVFLEKGVGVQADKEKAIKLYKLVLKRAKEINATKEDLEKIDIVLVALKRLYQLTNKQAYFYLMQKLQQIRKEALQKE